MKELKEPFKTVIEHITENDANIDYRTKNAADHEFLRKKGYERWMGSDCSYNVNGLPGLSASSYGDWGSYFHTFDKDNEALNVFLEMYEEGIIMPWRIRIYIDGQCYDYDDNSGEWTTYDRTIEKWVVCENPV